MKEAHTFLKLLERIDEAEDVKRYRNNALEAMKTAPEIPFRQGLNIVVKPNFDFDALTPVFFKTSQKTIQHPDTVEIFSGTTIDKEFFEHNKQMLQEFFSEQWNDKEDNQVDFFNRACTNDFLVIRIPPDTILDKPIIIDNTLVGQNIHALFIFVGKNAQAKILMNKYSDKHHYTAEIVRIIAEENSTFDFVSIQNLDKSSLCMQQRKAICKKDSSVRWHDICLGSYYMRSSIVSELKESGASTNNTVLYLENKDQLFDIYTASIHHAPYTLSDIVTKGVLFDEAKALSRGLVRIERAAVGSNGYEKQEALLLSDKAEAHAIPNLEINNHDVKCSHGSSIGQLDMEKVFYLMSRGFTKEQAQKKIIEGYFAPVLELFEHSIKEKVYHSIISSL
ncbi:MAG: hypothetical protein RL557_501 [archaeon]|jgi:Fe-S cluster assembly protein SufD